MDKLKVWQFDNTTTVNIRCVLVFITIIAAVGSTLISTTDFDVMTRASSIGRVITMQLEAKYRRNLDF